MSFKDLGYLRLDLSVVHTDHRIGDIWRSIATVNVLETNATLPFNVEIIRGASQGAWLSLTNVAEVGAYAQIIFRGQREM